MRQDEQSVTKIVRSVHVQVICACCACAVVGLMLVLIAGVIVVYFVVEFP